jgi:DNA adenine methylase
MTFEPKAVPFLRWIGGKKNFVPALAPQIKNYLEETGGHYVEPFVGGGAMMLALGLPKMVINDIITDLSSVYIAVRDSPIELGLLLCELREWGSEEDHYYAVRSSEPSTDVEAAARMIYLNAHCFNGLWRMNKKGQMNAAYGKQKDRLTDALLERIGDASEALQGTEIFNGDFEPLVKSCEKGDLLYLDPPYDGTYTGYSGEGFCGVSQDRLGSELAEAHKRGVAFICHNSDTEKVRNWFDYATIVPSGEARSVNRDGGGRGKVPCLLITNRAGLLKGHLTT